MSRNKRCRGIKDLEEQLAKIYKTTDKCLLILNTNKRPARKFVWSTDDGAVKGFTRTRS